MTATAITCCCSSARCGKSAQIPLFVWLPDAMAGPTPVSALIHAATMVTSGVYLMTRMNPVIASAYEWAPDIIAWVGVLTALFAATIAVAQNDIKKVLAYSTVSQLGYMFLAVGTGAYVAAIFHMVTHAFFKALLFLGSGSVIHGMHDEQDMRRMGGLRKYMPITAATFIVGWLAIAGVPPFAGFWSKDEILLYAYGSGGTQGYVLYGLGLLTALLTAFYMSRQVFLVFFGDERFRDTDVVEAASDADAEEVDEHPDEVEPHESPWTMTLPLMVLAGLSLVGGGLNLVFSERTKFLEKWLEPVVEVGEAKIDVASATKVGLAIVAVACAVVGIGYAYTRLHQEALEGHRARGARPRLVLRRGHQCLRRQAWSRGVPGHGRLRRRHRRRCGRRRRVRGRLRGPSRPQAPIGLRSRLRRGYRCRRGAPARLLPEPGGLLDAVLLSAPRPLASSVARMLAPWLVGRWRFLPPSGPSWVGLLVPRRPRIGGELLDVFGLRC